MSKYIKLEDAISEADRLLGMVLGTDFNEGVEHGILTIKFALLDLPTIEVSEDCISREYLEEQLQQIEDITAMAHIDLGEDPYDETEEITMPISTVRKIFKNAPSVVVRNNRTTTEQSSMVGEWKHDGSDWENRWICSECGYKLFEERTNFCPNCGSKMKGADE